jgi:hypothetical protein
MIHHVAIEVSPRDIEAAVGFFELLGFERVEPPATLRKYTWLEHAGTQVHLMPEAEPTVPSPGHLAVVVDDFDGTFARVREAGFGIEPAAEAWDEPRAMATAPGGHRVELMAGPPAPQT